MHFIGNLLHGKLLESRLPVGAAAPYSSTCAPVQQARAGRGLCSCALLRTENVLRVVEPL